jgi:hypothetical protein
MPQKQEILSKNQSFKRAGEIIQKVEHWPSKSKALSSNSRNTKRKNDFNIAVFLIKVVLNHQLHSKSSFYKLTDKNCIKYTYGHDLIFPSI